jgi:16S rRNA pseudouridine516 synthase
MMKSVGNEVISLKRLRMGTLMLDERLAPGDYRDLTQDELSKLMESEL